MNLRTRENTSKNHGCQKKKEIKDWGQKHLGRKRREGRIQGNPGVLEKGGGRGPGIFVKGEIWSDLSKQKREKVRLRLDKGNKKERKHWKRTYAKRKGN